jgi:hypothetical protein
MYPASKYIHTNRGNFDFTSILDGLTPEAEGLHVEGNWIVDGRKELVMLPPEYRTGNWFVWENTIALGSSSGHVVTMDFSEERDGNL